MKLAIAFVMVASACSTPRDVEVQQSSPLDVSLVGEWTARDSRGCVSLLYLEADSTYTLLSSCTGEPRLYDIGTDESGTVSESGGVLHFGPAKSSCADFGDHDEPWSMANGSLTIGGLSYGHGLMVFDAPILYVGCFDASGQWHHSEIHTK